MTHLGYLTSLATASCPASPWMRGLRGSPLPSPAWVSPCSWRTSWAAAWWERSPLRWRDAPCRSRRQNPRAPWTDQKKTESFNWLSKMIQYREGSNPASSRRWNLKASGNKLREKQKNTESEIRMNLTQQTPYIKVSVFTKLRNIFLSFR